MLAKQTSQYVFEMHSYKYIRPSVRVRMLLIYVERLRRNAIF